MDYSELVKSLRICVNGTTCVGCIKNADGTEYGCKPLGDIELVREAADAIWVQVQSAVIPGNKGEQT